MSRYFQGTSVLGPVRASAARNFREVVDALRICPVLGITRTAFLALAKRERNEIKQVPFFVPASFRETPSKRVYSEAVHCNLLFLDIDDAADASPFVHNPETLYAALDGLNFAAHTTASSTPDKPRMRVVVDTEAIPVADYPRAVASIGVRLGLAKVTTESRVAVQPMFLPTLFSDSTDDDHPLIAHHLDGRAFTVADIAEALPVYGEPHTPLAADTSSDSLDFLRAPVPEITLAIAEEALDSIDPDCPRNEWRDVASALKHQFSPHQADEAFELFEEWSKGGETKFTGEDDVRKMWDSLRPHPIGRLPVTIRSLLRQAAAAGWDDKKVKESGFNALIRWMGDTLTVTELMENGVKKILATPQLSAVQEGMLVDQLRAHAKSQFGYKATTADIKRGLVRIKAEMKAQGKPAEKVREPGWSKGLYYVSAVHEFYRHMTGQKYRPAALDALYSRHLLPKEKDLQDAGIPVTPAALAKPIVSPTDYALNHLKITTVYDYAYDPSQPTEVFFVSRGRRFVNTYSPTYPELEPEGAEKAGNLFCQHLSNLVAEPEYRKTLTDFKAFLVQNPGRKVRWACFVQSVDGAGKGFLADAAKAVLGSEHVRIVSDGAIKKGWTEWSFGAQLVVLNEVRIAGSNRHEIMNTLKPLITDDGTSVEQRNRDSREVANISNYLLFSNHHDALALAPGDRRYFVIKSPLQTKAQVLALGENYFPPLYAMLRDHPGALRSWLMDWQISADFNPDGHAPRTTYVTDMVNDGASDLTAAVRRLLIEGDYPLLQYDIVSTKVLMDVLHLEENIMRATSQQIVSVLREEGFQQCGRHLFGTDRHYLWARGYHNGTDPAGIALDREKRGLKNLEMQILS